MSAIAEDGSQQEDVKSPVVAKLESLSREDLIKFIKRQTLVNQKTKARCEELTKEIEIFKSKEKKDDSVNLITADQLECMKMKQETMQAAYQSTLDELNILTKKSKESEKLFANSEESNKILLKEIRDLKDHINKLESEKEGVTTMKNNLEDRLADWERMMNLLEKERDDMKVHLDEIKNTCRSSQNVIEAIIRNVETVAPDRDTVSEMSEINSDRLSPRFFQNSHRDDKEISSETGINDGSELGQLGLDITQRLNYLSSLISGLVFERDELKERIQHLFSEISFTGEGLKRSHVGSETDLNLKTSDDECNFESATSVLDALARLEVLIKSLREELANKSSELVDARKESEMELNEMSAKIEKLTTELDETKSKLQLHDVRDLAGHLEHSSDQNLVAGEEENKDECDGKTEFVLQSEHVQERKNHEKCRLVVVYENYSEAFTGGSLNQEKLQEQNKEVGSEFLDHSIPENSSKKIEDLEKINLKLSEEKEEVCERLRCSEEELFSKLKELQVSEQLGIDRMNEVTISLSDKDEMISRLSSEVELLRIECNALTTNNVALMDEREKSEVNSCNEVAILEKNVEDLKDELANSLQNAGEVERLKSIVTEKISLLDSEQCELETLTTELSEKNQMLDEFSRQLDDLKSTNSTIEDQLRESDIDAEKLRNEMENSAVVFSAEKSKLEEDNRIEVDKLVEKISELEEQHNENSVVQEQMQEIVQLKEEKNKLKIEKDELSVRVEEMSSELESVLSVKDVKIQELEELSDKLKKQLKLVISEVESIGVELEEFIFNDRNQLRERDIELVAAGTAVVSCDENSESREKTNSELELKKCEELMFEWQNCEISKLRNNVNKLRKLNCDLKEKLEVSCNDLISCSSAKNVKIQELQDLLKDQESQLYSVTSKLESTLRELDESKLELQTISTESHVFKEKQNQEISLLRDEIDSLIKKKNDLKKHIAIMSTDFDSISSEKDNKIQELEDLLKAQKAQLESLAMELEESKSQLRTTAVELESLQSEIHSNSSEKDEKNQKLESLLEAQKVQLDLLASELEKSKSDLRSTTAELESLQSECRNTSNKKEEKIQKLEDLLKTQKAQLESFASELEESKSQLRSTAVELESLQSECRSTSNEKDEKNQKLEDLLKAQKAQLDSLVRELVESKSELESTVTELKESEQRSTVADLECIQSECQKIASYLERVVIDMELICSARKSDSSQLCHIVSGSNEFNSGTELFNGESEFLTHQFTFTLPLIKQLTSILAQTKLLMSDLEMMAAQLKAANSKLGSLELELESMKAELNKHKSSLERTKSELESQNLKLQESESVQDSVQVEMNSLKEEFNSLQMELEEQKKLFEVKTLECDNVTTNFESNNLLVKELENELEELKVNFDSEKRKTELATFALEELKKELENKEIELSDLRDNLKSESETMKGESSGLVVEQLMLQLKEKEAREAKLKQLALKAKKETADLKNKFEADAAELNKLRTESANQKTSDQNVSMLYQNLQNEYEKLEKKFDSLKSTNEDLQKSVDLLSQELGQSKVRIADAAEEVDRLNEEVERKDRMKQALEEARVMAEKEVQAEKIQREVIQKEKLTFELRTTSLEAQLKQINEDHMNEVRKLKEEMKAKVAQLERARKDVQQSQMMDLEIADYERTVKSLHVALEEKDVKVRSLQDELQHINQQKAATTRLLETSEGQYKQSEEQCSKLKQLLVKIKKELAEARKQEGEYSSTETQLRTQNEMLTQLIEEQKLKLSELAGENRQFQDKLTFNLESHQKLLSSMELKLANQQKDLELSRTALANLQSDYDGYKIRVHSVLKQKQNVNVDDTALQEERKERERLEHINEQLKNRLLELNNQLSLAATEVEQLREDNEKQLQKQAQLLSSYEATESTWKEKLENLSASHMVELGKQSETIQQLMIQNENLAQTFKEQHTCVVESLKNQLDKAQLEVDRCRARLQCLDPSPPSVTTLAQSPNGALVRTAPSLPLDATHEERQAAEGSEYSEDLQAVKVSTGSPSFHTRRSSFVPLDALLSINSITSSEVADEEVAKEDEKSLNAALLTSQKQGAHLRQLLNESEATVLRLTEQASILKSEIRRLERNQERQTSVSNMEYLKNVIYKFLTLKNGEEKLQLVPVMQTMLKFSPEEREKVVALASREAANPNEPSGWSSYIRWPGIVGKSTE